MESRYWVHLALSLGKYRCWVRGCDDDRIIFDNEHFADEIEAAEYAEVLLRLDGYDLD